MKLTIGIDRNLQKIKKIIRKSYLVSLVVFLIAVAVCYMLSSVIPKNYPDVFIKNKLLFDQIRDIAGILLFVSLGLLFVLALSFLAKEPRGKFVFDYEKEDMRYRDTAVYQEVVACNKPKLEEAIKKKDLKFLFMMADDYKDRGYWVEEAEILATIVWKDPDGEYGIQAIEKVMEINYLKRIRGQTLDVDKIQNNGSNIKKLVKLNFEKPVMPTSVLRNRIMGILGILAAILGVILIYLLKGVLIYLKRVFASEYPYMSTITVIIIFCLVGVVLIRWKR